MTSSHQFNALYTYTKSQAPPPLPPPQRPPQPHSPLRCPHQALPASSIFIPSSHPPFHFAPTTAHRLSTYKNKKTNTPHTTHHIYIRKHSTTMAATRLLLLSFLLLSGIADAAAAAASPLRRRPLRSTSGGHLAVPTIPHKPRPGIQDCEELYFEQPIDHFAFHPESSFEGMTYKERFFVCGKQWWDGPGAPIFFYT